MDIIDKKQAIKELKEKNKFLDSRDVFSKIKDLSSPFDNYFLQTRFVSLFNNLNKEKLNLKKIRIAILATSTVSHFVEVLKFYLAKDGFDAEFYECDYGTLRQTILDTKSTFYKFNPEITLLFTGYRDVKFNVLHGANYSEIDNSVKQVVSEFTNLWKVLQENSTSIIIQNNADIPSFRILGNYEVSVQWSNINLLRMFNLELSKSVVPGVSIFDLDYISSLFGKKNWQDMHYWYYSKHMFCFDAIGLTSFEMAKTILAIKGFSKKCIVLDLDNTLWGGVIADDGLEGISIGEGTPSGEAFLNFQKYLIELKKRGIILAVCSKNFEETAMDVFLNHSDMQLKLNDFSAFKANFKNKAENIQEIATMLNIGLDSMVFIDDNPAERLLVKQLLPDVCVLDIPEDPSMFVQYLSSQSLFEIVQFSSEDLKRNEYYQDNAKREQTKKQFSDLKDYLQSLDMEAAVGDFDEYNLPRIVQLINKTNQFNLTTIRYSESEIRERLKNDMTIGRYYKLKDRFGDNGLIAIVILEKETDNSLTIDTWLMSCRVLSRGMEEFICNDIIEIAKQKGCARIIGKYIPTKKNKLVENLYENLKFVNVSKLGEKTIWELNLNNYNQRQEVFIRKLELVENQENQ